MTTETVLDPLFNHMAEETESILNALWLKLLKNPTRARKSVVIRKAITKSGHIKMRYKCSCTGQVNIAHTYCPHCGSLIVWGTDYLRA